MIVVTAASPIKLQHPGPVPFSAHFVGGAVHVVSITIGTNPPIALNSGGAPVSFNFVSGTYQCKIDFVVTAGPGALNRHYGIMVDAGGLTLASTIGDIGPTAQGDTGHALLMISVP